MPIQVQGYVRAGRSLKTHRQLPSPSRQPLPLSRNPILCAATPLPLDPAALYAHVHSPSASVLVCDSVSVSAAAGLLTSMVNAKNVAFKVNKQTPINVTPSQAYGTVINCRKPVGKRAARAQTQKEVRSHHVRLSNIEGTLKRKWGEEETGADGSRVFGDSPGTDATTASSSPDRVLSGQKWQPPKPTRLRKNKTLSKGVDLDCWFTILRFSDPAQLLEMRHKLASCYRFLRDNPMLWKHSRNYYYGSDMPDPPSELTEFQYAHLRHGHGCMSCGAPNTRKTYWAFLRRWCKTCLQSKTVKEHDAMVLLRDANGEDISYLHDCLPSGIFDSWGNFVGVGPATTHSLKTVFLLSDVRKLVADYLSLKAQNEDPAQWPAEVHAWRTPKMELVKERKTFAHKMEGWEETARSERSYDYQAKKMARKAYFQEKAAQLTPSISLREMECCDSYRRAIAIPKDPNTTSWFQLKPKLEKEAAALRAKGGPPEERPHTSSNSGTSTPNSIMDHGIIPPSAPQQPYILPVLAFASGFLPGHLPSHSTHPPHPPPGHPF